MSELEIKRLKARPVRIIPFDIGMNLDDQKLKALHTMLASDYSIIELASRVRTVLSEKVLAYKINQDIALYIFDTGIGVLAVKDQTKYFDRNLRYFSIDYCRNRKEAHAQILSWKHPYSSLIKDIIRALRVKAAGEAGKKAVRKAGREDFECNGISYVMTLSVFETVEPKNQLYETSKFPEWLNNNISVLLDPSLIYMEDSLKFCKDDPVENAGLSHIINALKDQTLGLDYERRKHAAVFMSWAAVVVIGEPDEADMEEYIAMEVELQHRWFYIYSLDKNLPANVDALKKSKMDIVKLHGLSYEVELLDELFKFIDDSSVPDRIKLIQDGLLKTSGIYDMLERYKRKLNFFRETLIFEGQVKQRKYSQTSELLLYFIAYVQIAPILFSFFKRYISGELLSAGIVVLAFLLGSIVLIMKNKGKLGGF